MRGPSILATGLVATVVRFDEAQGWGQAVTIEGRQLPFHCTAIADGSRTIEVGTEVRIDVVAGRMGRWEADRLAPLRP